MIPPSNGKFITFASVLFWKRSGDLFLLKNNKNFKLLSNKISHYYISVLVARTAPSDEIYVFLFRVHACVCVCGGGSVVEVLNT